MATETEAIHRKTDPGSARYVTDVRTEADSLGEVDVPADKLWGAQTQRSLEHFSIGKDLIPREMITAYAILKKAAATANHASKRLDDQQYKLIVQTCDEILAGQHHDMFPLHVWMTGSGTQFNMNVNEVISNRCCQLAGTPLGSKTPVHPNDHVNMAQSSNDSFPSAMYIAAAVNVKQRLIPAVTALARCHRCEGAGVEGHRQDRPHPHAGRHPADTWARNGPAMRECWRMIWSGSRPRCRGVPPGAGRHSSGNRHQLGARFCRGGGGRDRQAHWPALRHRTQQVHRAGRSRRAGAAVRHAAHPGRVALQDRQRRSPDVVRARAPDLPNWRSRKMSRARRSCQARSTRPSVKPSP